MLSRYKRTLLKLFGILESISKHPYQHRDKCLELQYALVNKIKYTEGRIQQRRQTIKDIKKTISKKPDHQQDDYLYKLGKLEGQIEEYQEIRSILKNIVDCLVFIYLRNYWDIKPLAIRPRPGYVLGKEGLSLEMKFLNILFSVGEVAILNDITNCLRYGDITVIRKNGEFRILEIKNSPKLSWRAVKQRVQAENILNYLESGWTNSLYEKKQHVERYNPFDSEEVHYRKQLHALTDEVLGNGFSYVEVESGLIYLAGLKINADRINEVLDEYNKQAWPILQLNPRKYVDTPYYYPIILSIRSPEAIYRFLQKDLVVFILLRPGRIQEIFEKYGCVVMPPTSDEYLFSFQSQAKDGLVINTSWEMFFRCFYQFLSVEWFVKQMINMLEFTIDAVEE